MRTEFYHRLLIVLRCRDLFSIHPSCESEILDKRGVIYDGFVWSVKHEGEKDLDSDLFDVLHEESCVVTGNRATAPPHKDALNILDIQEFGHVLEISFGK